MSNYSVLYIVIYKDVTGENFLCLLKCLTIVIPEPLLLSRGWLPLLLLPGFFCLRGLILQGLASKLEGCCLLPTSIDPMSYALVHGDAYSTGNSSLRNGWLDDWSIFLARHL